MPKFKVIQSFSNGAKAIYLEAASESIAQTIVSTLCDGEITVEVEATGIVGSTMDALPVGYKRIELSMSNTALTERTYLSLLVRESKSADEVVAVVKNRTINGVVCNNVNVINLVSYAV